MTKWKIAESKNGYIQVKPNNDGDYTSKKEAIMHATKIAESNKAILRVHDINGGYTQSDFTNILLPKEWISKLTSEVKIRKAEYMIAKTRYKNLKDELSKADPNNEEKVDNIKHQLKKAKNVIIKAKMNYKDSKKRLKLSKKNS